MSTSSSPNRKSITSLDEYNQLDDLYREAYDRVQSGGTGAGYSGIHYAVMNKLRKYGLAANSREEAIRLLKQLLTEYEITHLGAKTEQSDEEYLSKFDDIE
jgi:hypothetical protein